MELKMIDVSEMADMLGISLSHAYHLVNSGAIPSANLALPNAQTRRLKVNLPDLEKFIKEGGVKNETN